MDTDSDPWQAVERLVQERFKLTALYPYQELVIRSILECGGLFGPTARQRGHREQVVVLPTGSGKSVCFMVPALLLPGLTVAIYPLLSLMNDQARRIAELGFEAVLVRGGQSQAERQMLWERLEAGQARLVITNPEILAVPSVLSKLSGFTISLAVVDEVHTVPQWGQTFRPAYLALQTALEHLKPDQVVAFTATASRSIKERIDALLFGGRCSHLVYGNPDRPNIIYRCLPSLALEHDLEMTIRHAVRLPAIVFCQSREKCEFLAWELSRRLRDIAVRPYHAGLTNTERNATERWFHAAEQAVLVATTAYGMGVDKKNIRATIHVDLPVEAASFLQESGRSGRDGRQATSIVLLNLHARESTTEVARIFTQQQHCRRKALLETMGWPADSCNGCDICSQTVVTEADGQHEIMQLFRMQPLCWTIDTACRLLSGDGLVANCDPIRQHPLFKILSGWHEDDVKQAIQGLLASGILACRHHFPWKDKPIVVRKPK